jgi:hypothetical protein
MFIAHADNVDDKDRMTLFEEGIGILSKNLANAHRQGLHASKQSKCFLMTR